MTEIIKVVQENKKLRLFTSSDAKLIVAQFQGLSSLMGLKEVNPQNSKVMLDFVMDEFKDFSFEEIQTAFKMNIAGKLLDSRGEKTKPYGSFNIDYVGTVLALYRTYRTNELRKVNKASPMPEKSQEQKDAELKSVMEEIFQEMNNYYKQGMTSFTFNNGIKFYGCLKYFGIMPDYKSPELWEKAKQSILLSYMNNADRESRPLIAYIKDSKAPLSDDLKSRVKVSITNAYKGLLVSKCFNDSRELFDNLLECRD
tara:strand:+ start:3041 stop:3805 length:765 start_codon:yes stop_codon:yes gene_type:complete